MFFRSITTKIIIITLFTILLVGTSIFYLTLQEHENLYRIQVKNDLTSLSVNLSDDLVKVMAEGVDNFELANILLRLDKYDNIDFAKVFDTKWQIIEQYHGVAFIDNPTAHKNLTTQLIRNSPFGISYFSEEIISIQRIGIRSRLFQQLYEQSQTLQYSYLPPVMLGLGEKV